MIKTFCDSCDTEINESNGAMPKEMADDYYPVRVAVKNKKSGGEKEFLVVPLSGGAEGDYCQRCVVAEIVKLDKRTAASPE